MLSADVMRLTNSSLIATSSTAMFWAPWPGGSSGDGCFPAGAGLTPHRPEAHYAKGYALSKEQNLFRQAYYHGINLAFLAFVFHADREGARRYAREVLEICRQCLTSDEADEWLDATEGEAHLILGNAKAACAAYKRFVTAGNDPWKVGSCYLNARTIAADLADRNLARELAGFSQIHNREPVKGAVRSVTRS